MKEAIIVPAIEVFLHLLCLIMCQLVKCPVSNSNKYTDKFASLSDSKCKLFAEYINHCTMHNTGAVNGLKYERDVAICQVNVPDLPCS